MNIEMQTQADIDAEAERKRRNTRVSEIIAELDEIDKRKVRPISAFMLGEQTKDDEMILEGLNEKTRKLREEKKKIEGD